MECPHSISKINQNPAKNFIPQGPVPTDSKPKINLKLGEPEFPFHQGHPASHNKYVKTGGATSPLPAAPSRNRTKRQKSIHSQKQHNTAIKFLLFLGSPLKILISLLQRTLLFPCKSSILTNYNL